ncbi:ABC transporter ATP-binding protein [Streptococcus caprae]|uniref:ABC transporter ATP-binding protein n=1 Tax=Streptococcus caprae TaxID=1640501 RepID=A0ABV8CVF8_9STRE
MKDLLKYFKGYIVETILGPLFKLFEALFELLVPLVIARIIDHTIPSGDQGQLNKQIGILFGLAALGILVALIAQYVSSKSAVGFTKQLNQDLFEKIMSLPKESRDQIGTSSLVARLTADTLQIQTGINIFLRLFLRAPIIVFGAIIMAFSIDAHLSLYFLVMVAVLFVIVFAVARLLNPLYATIRKKLDTLVNQTREQLQGMRVIRAFGQVEREKQAFQETNQAYTSLQIKAGNLSNLVAPLTFLTVNVTLLIVLWQGGMQVGGGSMSQGTLVALVNYLLQILTELLKVAILVTNLSQAFVSAKRVSAIFSETSEDLNQPLPEAVSLDLVLDVAELYFSYPEAHEPALENLNFQLAKGESLGIIGGTGSGKTSLVQLLCHLYQPTSGRLQIFANGQSPRTIADWRQWVGLVPQKAELFKGTVRSNLMLGLSNEPVSDDQVWQVLEKAQAKKFVAEKEGGLEAPVEAFGRNFSGGQRQRLTIARSLMQERPFLVLDDSTSALDYLTESKVLTTLKAMAVTLVMVSQRTRSLQSLDKILVLDEGKQVGFGSHEELLMTCPVYREIHESQQV